MSEVYDEVNSSDTFNRLGPDRREDTKRHESSEEFTRNNGADGAVARSVPESMSRPCLAPVEVSPVIHAYLCPHGIPDLSSRG